MMAHKFDPDYVVPTSEILREWLDEKHLSTRVAAAKCGRDKEWVTELLDATLAGGKVTKKIAGVLAYVTDISVGFWIGFEQNYRAGLAAGKKVTK